MEIVLRQELQLECRDVGRNIVQSVRDGGDLTDTAMDKLFDPLIDSIQTKTMTAINASLDEFRGELEDKYEEAEMDDILSKKRADILDENIITINGVRQRIISMYVPHTNTKNIKIVHSEPSNDNEITDDELLKYRQNDSYWSQYVESYEITITDEHLTYIYNCIVYYNRRSLVPYCLRENISYDELVGHITELQNSGVFISDLDIILNISKLRKGYCQTVLKHGRRKGHVCGQVDVCRYHMRTQPY
jgi:hypothetical protein